MKFKDIVVNLVSGAMPSNRVGYYIKRFSQEASVRRLASLLLIGLFIFQSLVFIFPPKPSFASGGNDLIPGGIGTTDPPMKQNLINYVNADNYGAAFFQLMGLNEDYIRNNMSAGTIRAGDWTYSMGHNSFGGPGCSTRFDQVFSSTPFPGSDSVYVGSPSCRWSAGYSPSGLIGDPNRPVNIGGRWWQIGVIGDCGNIVLREVPAPNVPACNSLNLSAYRILSGQTVTLTGIASISGDSPVNLVDMFYAAYNGDSNSINDPLVPGTSRLESQGVGRSGDTFIDNSGKSFRFNTAGTYKIRLHVYSNQAPQYVFGFPGSSVGQCEKIITVINDDKEMRCQILDMANSGGFTYEQPFTPFLKGTATVIGTQGTKYPSKFEYILLTEVPADTPGIKVNFGGKIYQEGNPTPGGSTRIQRPVTYPNNNATTFTDPVTGAGFNADAFKQTLPNDAAAKNFLIILRVHDQNGNTVPENPDACYRPFTVDSQPTPPKIVCKSLTVTLSPAIAQVPNKPTFTGVAEKTGVGQLTPKSYEYNVYKKGVDGKYAKMPNSPVVSNSTAFTDTKTNAYTFADPGEYKVALTVVDQNNVKTEEGKDGSGGTGCEKIFTLSPQPPQCVSLTAQPLTASEPPKEITFTATISAPNGKAKNYTYEFGDGSTPVKVDSDQITNTTKHTYTAPGKYIASFTFEATTGSVLQAPAQCKVEVNITDLKYTKQVANMTQLTRDGQPIDANNVTAKANDVLRYQIGICNASGEPIKGYVFKDNISDILYYADMVDTGGGTVKTDTGTTVLEWPPLDVPALESGKKCVDDQGRIIPENFKTFKEFKVKIKDPVPATGTKQADPDGFDCKVTDEYQGNIVTTPINCSPIKIIETNNPLPRTGAGWALGIIGFFAASSIFLFFRNRMLKRELELASTLTEGMYGQS